MGTEDDDYVYDYVCLCMYIAMFPLDEKTFFFNAVKFGVDISGIFVILCMYNLCMCI